jgi:hypothetical protein
MTKKYEDVKERFSDFTLIRQTYGDTTSMIAKRSCVFVTSMLTPRLVFFRSMVLRINFAVGFVNLEALSP